MAKNNIRSIRDTVRHRPTLHIKYYLKCILKTHISPIDLKLALFYFLKNYVRFIFILSHIDFNLCWYTTDNFHKRNKIFWK